MAFHPELSASKLAGFLGLHKYQPAHEIEYELLTRDPVTKAAILELEDAHHRRPYRIVVRDVLKEKEVQDCVWAGLRKAKTTTDVTGVLEGVQSRATDLLGERFSPDLTARLAEEVRGQVSKRRGLANEATILNTYEAAREVKVTERNTKTLKRPMGAWTLVGRCDGYVASQNRIVDSKDRTRHWAEVPVYDEIQLRGYMTMYGATESELIERFPDGTTRHTLYPLDEEKWNGLKTAVDAKVDALLAARTTPEDLKRIVFANTVEI